ncbi:hypothetical protein BH11PSE8_BH11PSE8_16490 [soil metagenome]
MSARRGSFTLLACSTALALAACGEKPQARDASGKKADAEPWTTSDAAVPGFSAKGWKSGGDKSAWEKQIHQRNQSQNDYVR